MAEAAMWERRAGESAKAFAAFGVYRDLPAAERSAVRVASEFGRHVRLIERWRSRHRWVERAAAFDSERDRRKREAMLEETAEMGRRQAADAAAAQAVVMQVVAAFAARLEEAQAQAELRDFPIDEFLPLVLRAIPSLAAAARLEREARGLLDESADSEAGWEPPPVYRQRSPERFKELVVIGLENGDFNDVLAEKGLEVIDKAKTAEAAAAFKAELERLGQAHATEESGI
jgi:hypothetical protein